MKKPDPSESSILAYEAPDTDRPASASPTESELEREAPSLPALDYSPATTPGGPYAALRIPGYILYCIGSFIFLIGVQTQSAAIAWEIYDRLRPLGEAQATLALGWVAGIQVLPLFLLAIPAGHLADTRDRRRIIALSTVGAAACSVGLAFLSYRNGSIPWMYALLAVNAACLVVGRPARSSLLPLLVPQAVFSNAVTWNASLFQIATMFGPALGGFLVARSLRLIGSAAIPYTIGAVCSLAFGGLILLAPLRSLPAAGGVTDRSLLAGFRFVWRSKALLGTMLLDLFAVLLGGAAYLLPAISRDVLHIGPTGYGWLRAAESFGAFFTTMLIAHLPPMKKAGRNMLLAVAGFGTVTIIFGLSGQFWLSFAMLVLLGAFDSISVVVRHTLVQVLTPDAMRGRVSAVNNISIGASNELGGLESGVTARLFGLVPAVVLGGIGTLCTVLAIAARFPQIRRIGSLQDVRPEAQGKDA